MIYHGTFTIEQFYKHAPEKVFHAFADTKAKAEWFRGPPGWQEHERKADFRVGSGDRVEGTHTHHGGMRSLFVSRYHDIVPNQRIVYAYDMTLNGGLASVSLATIEFVAKDKGTVLTITEQGVYLQGGKEAHDMRAEGTEVLLKQIEASLDR